MTPIPEAQAPTPLRDEAIEVMARAIAEAQGFDPDEQVEAGFEKPWTRWTFFIPPAIQTLDALRALLAERGFVIRPAVATERMLDAVWEKDRMDPTETRLPLNIGWSEDFSAHYAAMIAASVDPLEPSP